MTVTSFYSSMGNPRSQWVNTMVVDFSYIQKELSPHKPLGYRQIRNFMVQKMKIIPPLAHFFRSLSICFVEVGRGEGEGLCKEKNLQILDPQEYVANEQAHLFWVLVAKAGDDSSSMLEEWAYFSLIIMYVCMYVQAHNNSNNRDHPDNMLLAGSSRRPNYDILL